MDAAERLIIAPCFYRMQPVCHQNCDIVALCDYEYKERDNHFVILKHLQKWHYYRWIRMKTFGEGDDPWKFISVSVLIFKSPVGTDMTLQSDLSEYWLKKFINHPDSEYNI